MPMVPAMSHMICGRIQAKLTRVLKTQGGMSRGALASSGEYNTGCEKLGGSKLIGLPKTHERFLQQPMARMVPQWKIT